MKRSYIKPTCEELYCDAVSLLAGSKTKSKMGDSDIDDKTNPIPIEAREDNDFFEDEDF